MSVDIPQNVSKTFKYSYPAFTNDKVLFKLQVPVEIPYTGSTRELVQRVIKMFRIPVNFEEELNEKLAEFVATETNLYHNERDAKLLNQLKNGEMNVDNIVKNWEKLFKENIVEYAEQKGTSDEEVFAAAYHKLVHSPALETILQVESSYANKVEETLRSRDEDIKKLTQNQTEEMEVKVRHLNTFTTEEDINELAVKQFEEQSLVAGRWGSQLDALWQTQRAEYRTWVMTTLEEYQSTEALNTPSNSPLANFTPLPRAPRPSPPRLEDSLTIHLGSQMKQTHNLRIAAVDVLDLIRVEDELPFEPSSRLQTALGLYSTELSAVVVLCEGGPQSPSSATERLSRAAAEYHFSSLESQLANVESRVCEPTEQRNLQRVKDQPSSRCKSRRNMQTGDFFITRHSNLAEVHVVFHLIVDDSLRAGDITSRHPAILGLRNILKTACCNDITNITLPLLLRQELTEESTAAWCLKRAELVLKCAKGFMLETAWWGGAPLRSLQLAVPPGIAPNLFHSLAALLPEVFPVPSPINFKPNKNATV